MDGQTREVEDMAKGERPQLQDPSSKAGRSMVGSEPIGVQY